MPSIGNWGDAKLSDYAVGSCILKLTESTSAEPGAIWRTHVD
jgi:hypothetical protein